MECGKVTGKKHHRAKKFSGSKDQSFYSESYYLDGEGSNYGRKDAAGNVVYAPYDEQSYLPRNRQLAAFLTQTYKPKTALVLGCARAFLVQAFRELGVDCQGIDISEWAIANAPSKIREHLVVGDICDLSKFKTDQFDVVAAFDVFEHITVPDLYTALDEASRVCRDTLILDVPIEKDDLHPDQSSGTDKSHVSVYSEKWWLQQFRDKRRFKVDGKDNYTYPEGNGGVTLTFRKKQALDLLHFKNLSKTQSLKELSEIIIANALEQEYKPSVNIIMINYNGLDFTPKCIDTLYHNTDYPFALTVVDNQSTDGSAEWLKFASKSYPNMTVIFSSELNEGFADGVNVGLRFLKEHGDKSPYILLLNNDTLFTQRNWLSLMVEALEKDPVNGVVSPKLLYPDGRIQYGGASFTESMQPYHFGRFKKADGYTIEREVPWATFACVLISRELLSEGLDAAYKLGTFEDVDFCTQARFNGYKILYAPQATVYHYEGASVFTVNKQHYQQQQQANGNLFYSRWAQWLRMNRNAYPKLYAEDA